MFKGIVFNPINEEHGFKFEWSTTVILLTFKQYILDVFNGGCEFDVIYTDFKGF